MTSPMQLKVLMGVLLLRIILKHRVITIPVSRDSVKLGRGSGDGTFAGGGVGVWGAGSPGRCGRPGLGGGQRAGRRGGSTGAITGGRAAGW